LATFLYRGIGSYATSYFIEFLAFGVIVYLLTLIPYANRKVIDFTMLIGNIILINPLGFVDFISLDPSVDRVKMGATYAMLPSVVATIIYMFFLRDGKRKIINFISYLSNIYLFILILTEGTRGAVMALLILFGIIVYIQLTKRVKKNDLYIYPISFVIISAFTTVVILNIEKLLYLLNDILKSLGVELATIDKTIYMIDRKGLVGALNSRDIVYQKA